VRRAGQRHVCQVFRKLRKRRLLELPGEHGPERRGHRAIPNGLGHFLGNRQHTVCSLLSEPPGGVRSTPCRGQRENVLVLEGVARAGARSRLALEKLHHGIEALIGDEPDEASRRDPTNILRVLRAGRAPPERVLAQLQQTAIRMLPHRMAVALPLGAAVAEAGRKQIRIFQKPRGPPRGQRGLHARHVGAPGPFVGDRDRRTGSGSV
jgi:hypothetical protein